MSLGRADSQHLGLSINAGMWAHTAQKFDLAVHVVSPGYRGGPVFETGGIRCIAR